MVNHCYPITEKTVKTHFEPSYFSKYLLMIIDQDTGKEIHSEEVAVTFIGRERKWLRGMDISSYYDHAGIAYWIRYNSLYHLEDVEKPHSGIFFTNNQLEQFEELVIKIRNRRVKYDSCHIETIQKDDPMDVKELVRQLRSKK